ncbi:MAG: cell wall/surface repeat-containing protein, partial [Acidimicrobiaceae bacterium]
GCAGTFDAGTQVILTGTPDGNSSFAGWSGACTGTGPCTVTIDAALTITATFARNQHLLTVSVVGGGDVASDPLGIHCGTDCDELFDEGTAVLLGPTAHTGWTFAGWSGACTGTGPCTVTMDAAKTVTATFARTVHLITFAPPLGNGSGTITCDECPPGNMVEEGKTVTFTATPALGSVFAGWGGACVAFLTLPNCTFTVDGPQEISAIFNKDSVSLAVTVLGTGTGTIESSPAGIACSVGLGCSHAFDYGTDVTLTATPGAGTTFMGWSGAGLPLVCTLGTPATCTMTLTAARVVNATFAVKEYLVTVRGGYGNGNGTISSNEGWLLWDACTSPICQRTYPHGTDLDLTSRPDDPQSSLAHWTVNGTDLGAGVLHLNITEDTVVEVWWDADYWLTVTRGGTGSGTVTDSVGAVNCGSDCLGTGYDAGDVVTLTATPAPGSIFAGWSSAPVVCTGAVSPCEFVWGKRHQEVTATFTALPTLSITKTVSLTEGDTGTKTALFVVSIPTPASVDITFDYATADGTATDGSDYNGGSGTGLVIPVGTTSYSFSVQVYGDTLVESDETFTLTISNSNAPLGNTVGTATIINDDDYPTVSFATDLSGSPDRSTLEGSTGTYSTHVALDVVLSAAYPRPVTVTYNTADITATAGVDYTHLAGTLTFDPGETSKTVFLDINAEYLVESDEQLRANLVTATNALIGGGAALVTI